MRGNTNGWPQKWRNIERLSNDLMNPVETPMMQLMQAFGATSPQSVAAMFGIQGAAGDIQRDYSSLFSGYLQASEQAGLIDPARGRIDLSKMTAQTEAVDAVDATYTSEAVQAAWSPRTIDDAFNNADALALLNGGNKDLSPEQLAGFVQSIEYRAAQPIVLTPENLQALQSLTPIEVAALQSQIMAPQAASTDAAASSISKGHVLPAQELLYLFGETVELPASLKGEAPGLLFGTNVVTPQTPLASGAEQATLSATVAQQATPSQIVATGMTATQATVQNGAGTDQPSLLNLAAAPDSATDTPADKLAPAPTVKPDVRADARAAAAQQQAADASAQADAEGQVLAVNQKARQTTQPGVNAAAATQSGDPAQTAAASTQAAAQPITGDNKRPADGRAGDNAKAETAITQATGKSEAAPISAPRAVTSWTSPWSTPERAAGWPDGFATGLISSGLGGMSGQSNPLGGMGLMGGRPDPLLGKQVAKQLNVNITRAVKAGDNQFSMRMDPPELGRVMVKLTFTQNGLVKSQVMAERPETLELLQREVRGLERAVEAGGHKAEPGGISFSLDSGGQESAGRAFAEAMQEDQLKEQQSKAAAMTEDDAADLDVAEEEIDLDEILAHVTPETGLDVRV